MAGPKKPPKSRENGERPDLGLTVQLYQAALDAGTTPGRGRKTMAEDKVARLELRIRQLEDQLKGFRAEEPQDVSADEVKAYQKVRSMLAADYGEFCGINDCARCVVGCIRC